MFPSALSVRGYDMSMIRGEKCVCVLGGGVDRHQSNVLKRDLKDNGVGSSRTIYEKETMLNY